MKTSKSNFPRRPHIATVLRPTPLRNPPVPRWNRLSSHIFKRPRHRPRWNYDIKAEAKRGASGNFDMAASLNPNSIDGFVPQFCFMQIRLFKNPFTIHNLVLVNFISKPGRHFYLGL